MTTDKPVSRLSILATTSSPCSFQSTAEEKEKKRQHRVSLANDATGRHSAVGTVTVNGFVPSTCALTKRSPIKVFACSWVTVSIDLRVGGGALAGAAELRDLILEQQQAVQERFGRR